MYCYQCYCYIIFSASGLDTGLTSGSISSSFSSLLPTCYTGVSACNKYAWIVFFLPYYLTWKTALVAYFSTVTKQCDHLYDHEMVLACFGVREKSHLWKMYILLVVRAKDADDCQINACRAWLATSWNYLMYILICLFVSPQWQIFFFLIKIL